MGKISTDDFVAISNLIGEYQWRVDDGEDSWIEFWMEDGVFEGGAAQTFRGKEELVQVPRWVKSSWDGGMRHGSCSLYITYDDDTDNAVAKYYNLVTDWTTPEPRLFTLALSTMYLVRQGDDWKIKRLAAQQLVKPRDLGATD